MQKLETTVTHLKRFVDHAKRTVKQAELSVQDGTASVFTVDAAHVKLSRSVIPVNHGYPFQTGVDLDWLWAILNDYNFSENQVRIEVDKSRHKINVHMPDGYTHSSDEIDTSSLSTPKTPNLGEELVEYQINAQRFAQFCRRADNHEASHVLIQSDNQGNLRGAWGDTEDNRVKSVQSSMPGCVALLGEKSGPKHEARHSYYSLDYLRSATKSNVYQGDLKVCLGDEYPIRLKTYVDGGYFTDLLAPRISS